MSRLDQTQRGRIRNLLSSEQDDTQAVSTVRVDDVELNSFHWVPPAKKDTEVDKGQNKKNYWLPKCVLVCVILLALLGGILAVVLQSKFHHLPGNRGSVSEDIVVASECRDVLSARLTMDIIIKCSIKGTTISGKVEVVHRNPALNLSKPCIVVNGTEVTCNLGRANCSSSGEFDIKFYDGIGKDAKVMFTRQVTVTIEAPLTYPDTNLIQVFSDKNTSKFLLSCLHDLDCSSYEMGFYGNTYELTDSIHCDLSYSDSRGYFINCSAEIKGDIIFQYGNGTDLTCQMKKGDSIIRKRNFKLPGCSDYALLNLNCSASSSTLYNCANKTKILTDCELKCPVIKECLNLRYWESGQCCSLRWCRNETNLHIDKSEEHFLDHLCTNN